MFIFNRGLEPLHEQQMGRGYIASAAFLSCLLWSLLYIDRQFNEKMAPDGLPLLGYQVGRGNTQKCVRAFRSYPEDSSILKIADAVGGPLAFCNLPILPWKRHFLNRKTRAIDQISPQDLTSALMRGADNQGRPFIAIRSKTSDDLPGVETLYQQRNDPHYFAWKSGHRHEKHPLAQDTVTQDTLSQLNLLAEGKTTNQNKKLN